MARDSLLSDDESGQSSNQPAEPSNEVGVDGEAKSSNALGAYFVSDRCI